MKISPLGRAAMGMVKYYRQGWTGVSKAARENIRNGSKYGGRDPQLPSIDAPEDVDDWCSTVGP